MALGHAVGAGGADNDGIDSEHGGPPLGETVSRSVRESEKWQQMLQAQEQQMPSGRGPANPPARTPRRAGLPAPAFVARRRTQILRRN